MTIKKLIAVILTITFGISVLSINASAYNNDQINIYQLDDYDYYYTFAKALKDHNYELVAEFIPCTDPKQFKYSGVNIKDFSVEIIEKNDGYSQIGAYITFNITKSNNSFFKKGKHKYFAYFNMSDGENGTYLFYPMGKKTEPYWVRYPKFYLSDGIADYITDFGSATQKQIKNMEYTGGFIHFYYHYALSRKYPNGISKTALTKELNKFYGSKKQISPSELDNFTKKDGLYFKECGHGMPVYAVRCKKTTKNKKTGYYTDDMWYYSDATYMNVCRKIKVTYAKKDGGYILKNVDCYYSNGYRVKSL